MTGEVEAPDFGGASPDVLLVDDDEVVRGLLAWLFEQAGYAVRQACDGEAALAALAEDPPRCVVLDLMMPGVDGEAVLRARREQGLAPDACVVVLTAKTQHRDEVWCWERGADEYLTKPFEGERLLRLVRDLLVLSPEQRRHRREVGLDDAHRVAAIERAIEAVTPKRPRPRSRPRPADG